MGKLEQKQAEYKAIMDGRKGPAPSGLTGTVDPFMGCVERMMDEVEILDRASKAWNLSFCPCSIGAGTLSGGLYLAYDAAGNVKAIVHPERFHTTAAEQTLNFWSFQVSGGESQAAQYRAPFVILIELKDGMYALNFEEYAKHHDDHPVHRRAVGRRIAKQREFEDVVSSCDYVYTKHFRSLRKKAD